MMTQLQILHMNEEPLSSGYVCVGSFDLDEATGYFQSPEKAIVTSGNRRAVWVHVSMFVEQGTALKAKVDQLELRKWSVEQVRDAAIYGNLEKALTTDELLQNAEKMLAWVTTESKVTYQVRPGADLSGLGDSGFAAVQIVPGTLKVTPVKPPALERALVKLLARYVSMVGSGDCGNWDPELDDEVIEARAALAMEG